MAVLVLDRGTKFCKSEQALTGHYHFRFPSLMSGQVKMPAVTSFEHYCGLTNEEMDFIVNQNNKHRTDTGFGALGGLMDDLPLPSLEGLHERHPGLTPALGQTYAEAAFVCLSRHHQPPVTLSLKNGAGDERRVVNFPVPDERVHNAHANETDATEAGAYGVSLAAIEAVTGLVAVRRAETLTGADWYIAPIEAEIEDLESCIRLEVSGSSSGSSVDIRRRLQEKIAQAARGKSNLPAIAAVVGFKALEVAISPLSEPA